MRYLVGFLIPCVVALVVLSVGCVQECGAAGCTDGVEVDLVPGIDATYDVTLVLDGEAGAFTCAWTDEGGRWTLPEAVGAANVEYCTGQGFLLRRTPESVEITVDAEDGSSNGSLSTVQITFTPEAGDTTFDLGAVTCSAGCTEDRCQATDSWGQPFTSTISRSDDTLTIASLVTVQMVSDEVTPCQVGETQVSVLVAK